MRTVNEILNTWKNRSDMFNNLYDFYITRIIRFNGDPYGVDLAGREYDHNKFYKYCEILKIMLDTENLPIDERTLVENNITFFKFYYAKIQQLQQLQQLRLNSPQAYELEIKNKRQQQQELQVKEDEYRRQKEKQKHDEWVKRTIQNPMPVKNYYSDPARLPTEEMLDRLGGRSRLMKSRRYKKGKKSKVRKSRKQRK